MDEIRIHKKGTYMQEIKEMLFDGTSEEFRRIVESYKLLLYSVVYAASAYAEADDIVQETFIYAYYHWGMLREKEKLSAWLCAIAKNKAARAMRTAGKTVSMEKLGDKVRVSSPEAAILRREERMEIREKLYSLSEKYREAVMLHYFAEKSISEIASLLKIPVGTVKYRLHEGRKHLKKELIDMMNEEKKQVEEKNVWENIEAELRRAYEASDAYQKGEANAILDKLIEQFQLMDPRALSKEELCVMIRAYNQKFYANMHMESREKNIIYMEKSVELAEISGDEKLMQGRYSAYACELGNLGRNKESIEYYEKSLVLAEKLNDIPQVAALNSWLGTSHLDLDSDHVDLEKAKAYFTKAVSYKDALLESDHGRYIYALVYSAFAAISRVKDMEKLIGFDATSPSYIKKEDGLHLFSQPGYGAGKYINFCANDALYFITRVEPFLSNDICEGYSFETDGYSLSKTPVRSRYEVVSMNARAETPAGTFENCLHVRYTDKTEDEINFKRSGVRDMFYAPDVGLVLMHFKAIGDWEYTVKLREYDVTPVEEGDLCERYLPLTIGNVWYYDIYGADGKRFDKVDYENRFEVVTKRKNDAVTFIAHSGWICKKD